MPGQAGEDTIFALASAEGRAGVSVVRISGSFAKDAGAQLCGSLPVARRAGLRVLRDSQGAVIDEALVLVFDAGQSFTGEDVVELHCHGSPAVLRRLLQCLRQISGLRSAGAGEFTRRAFENGRLDLTQVEGLGDLIDAETEAQRRQAIAIYDGKLSRELEEIRQALLTSVALCEAGIDFADEELPEDVDGPARDALALGLAGLETVLRGHKAASLISNGFEIAIVGPPNAGKSTLLNTIAGDDIAIVTEVAGTTRDVIECRVNLNGRLVTFLDTAGLRETDDIVEREGIRRAEMRAKRADMRLFLSTEEAARGELWVEGDIFVLTKADLSEAGAGVSAVTGQGMPELLDQISAAVVDRTQNAGLVASERQAELLTNAKTLCQEAMGALDGGLGSELVSHYLRDALQALEEVVGRVGVEEVLGEIFSSFCIGK